MKSTTLGEYEELVLLVLATLSKEDSYGVMLKQALIKHTGRKQSIGALHSALYRLEEKGFISATMGGATSLRGGRRKKFYEVTTEGRGAMENAFKLRDNLYKMIPNFNRNL